jgi:uncharacterized protein with GYD domain
MRCSVSEPALRPVGNHGMRGALNREGEMAKYLFEASYTTQGTTGLLHEGGTARRAAIEKMVRSLKGEVVDIYYAFGDVDCYVIAELPDNVSAAAVALAVNHAGAATVKTIVLMTVDEVDRACHLTVSYRPPA